MQNSALLLIDFQNDYFSSYEGAKWKLDNTEMAASNAKLLLDKFREDNNNIIFVRHEFPSEEAPFFTPNSDGAKIHETLTPQPNEIQILKNEVNSFKGTNLKQTLDELKVENLIIVGAMSHMCIDAVTRAASDYGYNCYVAQDACATLDLQFNDTIIPSNLVHAAYMSALAFAYAKVEDTKDILKLL